jgi:hypothetical protein
MGHDGPGKPRADGGYKENQDQGQEDAKEKCDLHVPPGMDFRHYIFR